MRGADPTGGPKPESESTLYRYRFGAAEFDEARLELRVGGAVVELEPRPLQVLLQLLRHPDELVTREELFDAVWGNRPTVDNVLANAVAKLRKGLGDEASERIVTLPRLGYRLSGPLERIATGRRHASQLDFSLGAHVPGRANFRLERQLGISHHSEVWLARHDKTKEVRVYKFAADGERLATLKREATLYRVLRETLGERDDLARIIDWNFQTPPFYLECEYGGENLQQWAAEPEGLPALSQEERVALLLRIALTVGAAHGVGVLHKDLKPANVLVMSSPHGLKIRVADFGSGHLLEPERLEGLGITALGLTVAHGSSDTSGTALYLAPEVLRGEVPNAQSDLYALGLMLFQLLAGDLRRPLAPGWEQMIADELLREDIAAATDGDPKRRLGSVSELCERLRTLSQRREERAALASAAERARLDAERLVRTRARRPWIAAAAVTLLLGSGASLWGFHRESIARREAQREADIATAVNRFMIDKFIATADPNISGRGDVSVAEAVHAAIPGIDAEFANRSPEIQAALHLAMQKALSQLSDPKAAVDEARKAILAFKKTDPVDLAHLAESHIWMANDLSRIGDYRAAAGALDEAQQELPRLAHPDPVLQVRLLEVRSMIAADQMDVEGGYQLTLRALRLADSSPGVPAALHDTLQFDTADSQIMLGKTTEAEATLRDLKARQEKRLGPGSPQTLNTQVLLANCLVAMHRYQEAEALIVPAIATVKATWGDKSRRTILAESVLANLRALQSRFAESAALYSSLHARMVELYGATNQTSIAFLEGAAVATQYGGHVPEAEGMLRNALGDARAVLKEDNPQVEHLRYRLAANLLEQRKGADEAGRLLDQLSIPVLNAAEQRSDWDGRLAFQQARLLIESGQPAAALPLLKKADAVARGNASPDYDLKSVPAALAALPAATSARSAP